MWHMTFDALHITCDIWHINDIWHLTCGRGVNILSIFKLPTSYRRGGKVIWTGGKGWLAQFTNESMSDKGVCISAGATPVLLEIP